MLGLAGVVVKSHGGTDAQGFAHAVDVAMDMVVHRFNDRMREGLSKIGGLQARAADVLAGENGTGSQNGPGIAGIGPLAAAG
jgi:hypothetical protein